MQDTVWDAFAGARDAPAQGPALAPAGVPRLSAATAPLTEAIETIDEAGRSQRLSIPAERALTVYVDRDELVTLMTLGARPEWLVLGYLLNQRLVDSVTEIESVTVDWDVGAAGVRTHRGQGAGRLLQASRTVTTGCGQGSVFGQLMEAVDSLHIEADAVLEASRVHAVVDAIRRQDSLYKAAGSVHGCALFTGERLALFIEDVGRHNAIDTLAGWAALQPPAVLGPRRDWLLYTTGRLTSEMIIKAAQMRVPVVVSRSGITQMGLAVAQRTGVCAIGRATHRRFLVFAHGQRLRFAAEGSGAASGDHGA